MVLPDPNSNKVKRLLEFENWKDDEREKDRWLSLWNEHVIDPDQESFEHYQEHVKEMLAGVSDSGVFPLEMLELYD
jgi:hypothetical protein